tara:strand:+ start:2569 stop:2856 length:288 start_codon:yes stop_codon:yes gene_type:complete
MTKQAEYITIEASIRKQTGKVPNRKIRQAGKIPGNLVEKSASTPITLDSKWLSKIWQNGKIFNLKLDSQEKKVRIKELQLASSTRKILHLDVIPL